MKLNPVTTIRLAKWIGYPLFGFVSFLVFLYITFPYGKLKDRLEQQLSASGDMTVTIDELGPSPLLGLSADRVLVKLKPSQPVQLPQARPPGMPPGEGAAPEPAPKPKPMRILLDRVVAKFGLLASLRGATDLSFKIEGFGGQLSIDYEEAKKTGWSLDLEAEKINLGSVPAIGEFVGLPVKGQLFAELSLVVPGNRWSDASGQISVECEECSVGDGKAKLKIPGNALLAMGITLPKIRLGRFGGQVKVEKGVATLENVLAKSPDIEVSLEGSVSLRNPVGFSNSNAYLRFKISPELKKRDPKFELLENGLGSAKRPDGFFGMRLVGPLKHLKPVPSSVGPSQRGGPAERFRGPGGPRPRGFPGR